MRSSIIAAALALSIVSPAAADERRVPAIESTIQRQFDAFAANDLDTAFSFASPTIQGMFGTPENFGTMVQSGYPMVWRHGSVKFGALRKVGGALWQTVVVSDPSGAVHVLEYQMDPDGAGWEIDGVTLQRGPQVGA